MKNIAILFLLLLLSGCATTDGRQVKEVSIVMHKDRAKAHGPGVEATAGAVAAPPASVAVPSPIAKRSRWSFKSWFPHKKVKEAQ